MTNRLEIARDLLKSCMLPELKSDLDSVPIHSEQFVEFHTVLRGQLPLLYDFLQQQTQWLQANDESELQEIQALLLVLLSELTADEPQPVYKLHDEYLLRNANTLLEKYCRLDDAVEQLILAYYQSELRKDNWKRHLGAVHGFLQFLHFRYNEANGSGAIKMSSQWLTFCLSVSLCVRESHEPTYKQIGIRIFLVMLQYGRVEDIKSLNIHSVIYDDVFKDVHYMDSLVATADIWHCLCKCLDYYTDIDSMSWSICDDMIEALLRNITLAPDSVTSICLLKFVTKLCAYFSINRQEIVEKCTADFSQLSMLEECRTCCVANSSYTPFRWAKHILTMFIAESYKLKQSPSICRQLLVELHKCYMVVILPIDLLIIEPQLVDFFEKFTAILLEIFVLQKQHTDIKELVCSIINTFHLQLQHSPRCEQSALLQKHSTAFGKLLQHLRICTK